MVPTGGLKETRVPEVPLRVKGGPKVLWREKGGLKVLCREKGVETKSYADAVKLKSGRIGDSVWLELGKREVQGRLDQMKQCLVGWRGDN